MKKVFVKIAVVAAMLVSMSGVGFAYGAYNSRHYDHATLGEQFDPNSMVTQRVGTHYVRSEKTTVYAYEYGDGTICRVAVDQYGYVIQIRIVKP